MKAPPWPGTIVVGYDERDPARDALALARLLARVMSARLLLAHVAPFDPFLEGIESRHWERVLGVARDEAESSARAAADEVPDVRAQGRAVYGRSPAQALADLAQTEDAGLIVVGSSDRGRRGRLLAGSVGARLLHGSPCPVAVAPRDYAADPNARLEVIGCGVDGSAESRAALSVAGALARSASARLLVLAVFEPLAFGHTSISGALGSTTANQSLRRALREALESSVASVPEGPVRGELLDGDPGEVLSEHSEGLDLLVVGSRRYGPLRSVLLGGVSSHLIRTAACPVLVVPRPARPETTA